MKGPSQILTDTITKLLADKYQISNIEIVIQPTRKEFVGSHTFTVFQTAKLLSKNPELVGNEIGEALKSLLPLKSFNVVKGFLNIEFADEFWLKELKIIESASNYGFLARKGKVAMVEYSSPNTNKPLHLGHLRNNFLGYSVSKILDVCGYDVIKANLVNDRGIHICKSMLAYELFGNNELPNSAPDFLKGDHLVGKYYVIFDKKHKEQIAELVATGISEEKAAKETKLIKDSQEMLQKWEAGDAYTINLWKKMNGWVYEGFKETYQTMGVSFDKTYYESNTYLLGKEIVDEGIEKTVFYEKEDHSVWINLTDIGLDEKLVLRGDGTSVYITQDLGTADLKYNDFKAEKSIYVVGNEQDYHFKVLFEILKRIEKPYAKGLFHLSYGMVELPSGKMKSREGTVVDADDLMAEMINTAGEQAKELGKIEGFSEEELQELFKTIGLGALKYFLLKVDPKKKMMFNPEESIELQGNTGPFIQYTYTRIRAILRKAKESNLGMNPWKENIELNPAEAELIVLLQKFPEAVADAGENYSPALVANYVYDVAKSYNRFYAEVPIFNGNNDELLSFRLSLSEVTSKTIRTAMELLGINVPERM